MNIVLAPMEGLADPIMRDLLTRVSCIDYAVTEFLRVSSQLHPERSFYRVCPELRQGSKTRSGVPVHLQLMGSDPDLMAANAERAAKLGAAAVDLNFGCPAKGVNSRRGGAILLETPDELFRVVKAVRDAVPDSTPVTAKMRLGYKDKSLYLENAQAIEAAGADRLTVHARTKEEGYKPPAHWQYLAHIKDAVSIPIIANGEIWSYADYQACREISGCTDVMLGRGQVSQPDLAKLIKDADTKQSSQPMNWPTALDILLNYMALAPERMASSYVHGRIKQWLKHLSRNYPEAGLLLTQIKTIRDVEPLNLSLRAERGSAIET